MKLTYTSHFERDYRKLSSQIQKRTDKKLKYLVEDITHPSLRVRRVKRYEGIFEASITRDYRLLFEITGEGYTLHRISKHDILDKL